MDWVLKGGTVLLIRNGYGRFTQDIDLARAKICAMYETHHGKSSNRFHDLADIVQIVCTQNFSVATSPVQLS
ncbi:MAG: nucleotidyl transferase AbiEii/AbiGii toxin family protein [Corynebacterium sp.]|nr:nucleotidyl transferase AbiEii/AbiGii toxin family protein [Corynebacterium sp.]